MTLPLWCLLGFAVWALVLVLCIGLTRVTLVQRREMKPNQFTSGVPHGGDRYWRLNRAHLNTLENLPIFGAIVLVGHVAGVNTPIYLHLPVVILVARPVQSFIHVASGSNRAVNLRFLAYATQLTCMIGMVVEIIRHA